MIIVDDKINIKVRLSHTLDKMNTGKTPSHQGVRYQ